MLREIKQIAILALSAQKRDSANVDGEKSTTEKILDLIDLSQLEKQGLVLDGELTKLGRIEARRITTTKIDYAWTAANSSVGHGMAMLSGAVDGLLKKVKERDLIIFKTSSLLTVLNQAAEKIELIKTCGSEVKEEENFDDLM